MGIEQDTPPNDNNLATNVAQQGDEYGPFKVATGTDSAFYSWGSSETQVFQPSLSQQRLPDYLAGPDLDISQSRVPPALLGIEGGGSAEDYSFDPTEFLTDVESSNGTERQR
jgi:hypothetical protein